MVDKPVQTIVVPVLVALLVASSAPWWWDKLFPEEPSESDASTATVEQPSTPTVTEAAEVEAPIDVELSAHIWSSANLGSPNILEGLTYEYRAGISHVEDLPPAGISITALTYDVSGFTSSDIVEARFDLTPTRVEGSPFTSHGDLLVEQVDFTSAIDARQESGPILLRTDEPPGLIDVTDALKEVVGLGNDRFQVRLRFLGTLARDEEFTAISEFVEWDYPDGPALLVLVES